MYARDQQRVDIVCDVLKSSGEEKKFLHVVLVCIWGVGAPPVYPCMAWPYTWMGFFI